MTDATSFDSAQELLQNLRAVRNNTAFIAWKDQVTAQIEGRKNENSVVPMKSMDDAIERNFLLGEIAGMLTALRFWDLMQEDLEEVVKDQPQENQNVQTDAP